ncbi:Lipase (class 3) [Sporomusa malonica]|uniref:Lipase (Class 3) n=2 Tax=Sporomusa malonica TaxID=112901 RepID=A0A1W1Y7V8_9FIRM|nr:Lipase (class 3) [Sporomusa malonica]
MAGKNTNRIIIGFLALSCLYILFAFQFKGYRNVPLLERTVDNYMDIALSFSHAAYVQEWDRAPESFDFAPSDADGSYKLNLPGWDSSKAFNRLARSGWKLYFNYSGADVRLQDTQILTGSRVDPNNKLTFVVAFRGSNNIFDYLFTNLKNDPVSLTGISVSDKFEVEYWRHVVWDQHAVPSIVVMTRNAMTTWLTNLTSVVLVCVHRGYMEQVLYSLDAKVIDPVSGGLLSVVEALDKYPDADFVITGHSSGGGAAQILSALVLERGGREQNIHIRTFATAGAFNYAGQAKYRNLDSINYFIPNDPILIVNTLTGYGPLGIHIMVPPTRQFSQNNKTVHEMTAYEEQLRKDD